MKKDCVVCGAETTHHHNYCDKHYPKENFLLKEIRDLRVEIRELKRKEVEYKLILQRWRKREKDLCNRLRQKGVDTKRDV